METPVHPTLFNWARLAERLTLEQWVVENRNGHDQETLIQELLETITTTVERKKNGEATICCVALTRRTSTSTQCYWTLRKILHGEYECTGSSL
jgi:hypothetical protein